MPLTHTRTFSVRYYECDAHGHLNNANYLRYMQEAAFDASAAAGYDLERYTAMQRLWLIRESGIEYLRPLHYNERVAVKTWIADFQRVSSRRAYEFYLPANGERVANAYTDWVFLNTASGRIDRIPNSLAVDFYPDGVPDSFPPRQPFLQPPEPPPGVYRMRHTVAWSELDNMQHVNNAVYMKYVTDCGANALRDYGWPWERMQTYGIGIYLRKSSVQYLQPALLGDELEIATWVSDVRRATAQRHYTIRRAGDGVLLAQANTFSVWVNLESGQPRRIPKDFLADFAANIA
ncbi:acyl-CoA thioesterase [Chloroflexota bacterium]